MLLTRTVIIPAGSNQSAPLNLDPALPAQSGPPVSITIPSPLDITSTYAPFVYFWVSDDGITFTYLMSAAGSLEDVMTQDTGGIKYVVHIPVDDATGQVIRSHAPIDPSLFRGSKYVRLALADLQEAPLTQTADRAFVLVLSTTTF